MKPGQRKKQEIRASDRILKAATMGDNGQRGEEKE